MRRFILARQMCCVRGCSAMSSRNNRRGQARLRADHRALHPTSTPSVPLAVISPNQRCLLVQLLLARNEYTGNECCISNSVSPMHKVSLPASMRLATKEADVIKSLTTSLQLQIHWKQTENNVTRFFIHWHLTNGKAVSKPVRSCIAVELCVKTNNVCLLSSFQEA